jgi:hypothetical protein
MNMIRTTYFKTIGFVSKKFTDEELKPIKDEINLIQQNWKDAIPANTTLAGKIKKEYVLSSSIGHIQELLNPLISAYDQEFDYFSPISVNTRNCPVMLETAWVNFQEKYEYNPVHNHGGLMSFVIWVKIPFSLEEESKIFPDTPRSAENGSFSFLYTNTNGQIRNYTIPVDSSYENVCVMFPSTMMHCVHPFYTSNDYRISVSGNFKIQV